MKKFLCTVVTVIAAMAMSLSVDAQQAWNGTYSFNPPQDNFYVKYVYNGETITYGRIGNCLLKRTSGEWEYLMCYDYGSKKVAGSEDGREWFCYDSEADEMSAWRDGEYDPLGGIFDSFEEFFLSTLRAYFDDISRLPGYYAGEETVAGVKCWVFDSKGLNAIQLKFWIDPANGCCLKYYDKEDAEVDFEVLEYNTDYTTWTSDLMPADKSGLLKKLAEIE